jgi:proteasome assembly chaperone 3
MQTLHSLYAAQIATLVWLAEDEELLGGDRRSVIVGIALRKATSAREEDLNEEERNAYHGIMGALQMLLMS